MNYCDFLSLAKRLKDQQDAKEVEFRTSMSRAHAYAYVFLKERFSNDRRITFENDYMDKKLLGELFKKANKEELHREWVLHCKDRNDAEYNMKLEVLKSNADGYIEDIECFVNTVKQEMKVKRRTV